MLELAEFQQFLQKSGTVFEQFLTLEPASVSEEGDFNSRIITMGVFNDKGNMFVKGSFDEFIAEKPTVPMYFVHRNSHYIGVFDNFSLQNNDNELWGQGHLFVAAVQEAQEKRWMIANGFLNAVSAGGGGKPKDVMIVDRVLEDGSLSYGLVFSKAYLNEVSLVQRPGDATAMIQQDHVDTISHYFRQDKETKVEISIQQMLDFTVPKPNDAPAATGLETVEMEQVLTPASDLIERAFQNS